MENKTSTRLRAMRKSKGYSTQKVLKELKKFGFDYKEQSIYTWEQGKITPSIDILNALAQIYQCSISYLIDNKSVKYMHLTANEMFLLRLFRTDFLFRNIVVNILEIIKRDNLR